MGNKTVESCSIQNKLDYLVYRSKYLKFKVKGNDLVVRCKIRVSSNSILMTNFSHSNCTCFFLLLYFLQLNYLFEQVKKKKVV